MKHQIILVVLALIGLVLHMMGLIHHAKLVYGVMLIYAMPYVLFNLKNWIYEN
jgi:hypothetical protein